jgi:hypothetical protein
LIDQWITNNTGKSGVYIPNFKGFMVGNGIIDYNFDGFPARFEMGYYFGMIDNALYHNVKNNCNLTGDLDENCTDWVD